MNAKIYMTACMKGGCAKTVTTYNLAYSLQKLGKKVLAVDFDSQANLTTCFGVEEPAAISVTIGHLMMAQIDDEELPAPEEYIMSRHQWFCQQWMQSLDWKWEQRRCWQAF